MNDYIQSRMFKTNAGEIFIPDPTRCSDTIGNAIYDEIKKPSRTVIFAFDSVNYFEFERHFHGKLDLEHLQCYTSAFPTGSPIAFSSIFFRCTPAVHRIFGIAFYSEEDNGIYQTSKGRIIDSHNNAIGSAKLSIHSESILSRLIYPSFYVYVNNFWHGSPLWRSYVGDAKRVVVKPLGHYKESYDRIPEFREQLVKVRELMEGDGNRVIWVFLDLDETLHQEGVKTVAAQTAIDTLTSAVASLINEYGDYSYYLLADHGQIDMQDTFEFPYDKVGALCYAYRGGLGRTHYFYTKSSKAYTIVKDEIGDTGIVLKKDDPLLRRIFNFDPTPFSEIGDVVAIATKPSFPSYGWMMKAEHGALSKEEVFVPFLHIKKRE